MDLVCVLFWAQAGPFGHWNSRIHWDELGTGDPQLAGKWYHFQYWSAVTIFRIEANSLPWSVIRQVDLLDSLRWLFQWFYFYTKLDKSFCSPAGCSFVLTRDWSKLFQLGFRGLRHSRTRMAIEQNFKDFRTFQKTRLLLFFLNNDPLLNQFLARYWNFKLQTSNGAFSSLL
jgi:hypothetical protein